MIQHLLAMHTGLHFKYRKARWGWYFQFSMRGYEWSRYHWRPTNSWAIRANKRLRRNWVESELRSGNIAW